MPLFNPTDPTAIETGHVGLSDSTDQAIAIINTPQTVGFNTQDVAPVGQPIRFQQTMVK